MKGQVKHTLRLYDTMPLAAKTEPEQLPAAANKVPVRLAQGAYT